MFDIPRDRILPVREITVSLADEPHPYELANRGAIDANWDKEIVRQPKLFDGEMILLSDVSYRDGCIVGQCHPIRFATFLHWRKNRAASDGFHVFANAMPVTADGALIAIRMAPHTANAGRVYFAAGSFERQDFRDGFADVAYNIRREVAEETGIDLADVARDDNYHAYCTASGLTLIRRYYLEQDVQSLLASIRAHIASEAEPEADQAVGIRSEVDVPESAPAHMKPLVRWHFSADASTQSEV